MEDTLFVLPEGMATSRALAEVRAILQRREAPVTPPPVAQIVELDGFPGTRLPAQIPVHPPSSLYQTSTPVASWLVRESSLRLKCRSGT